MGPSLAPYAVDLSQSRGRRHQQNPDPYGGPFEQDRDRIIHCSAFRRLEAKTQVFTPGVNENYRTRLTHSIEVAQIARTIARVLDLNEALAEAIALGHDLGHSPFGHVGEQMLHELMRDEGGFEHNRQALRIVEWLEHPYAEFAGLNLMYETRLGLARHRGPHDRPDVADEEFTEPQCSLEGQAVDAADRIAYNAHDLEDGLRARLLEENVLQSVPLFAEAWQQVRAPDLKDPVVRRTQVAKTLADLLVKDVIETSRRRLVDEGINAVEQVLAVPQPLLGLSDVAEQQLAVLEQFLLEGLYHHPTLQPVAESARRWLSIVFERLCEYPDRMPRYFQSMIPLQGLRRTVCDYVAGMTDRFCQTLAEEET
jgi:dGTPase